MLRLSRLPRSRSINIRNTHFLDCARLPSFVCPQFTIRALPNAVFHEPVEFVPINPLLVRTQK